MEKVYRKNLLSEHTFRTNKEDLTRDQLNSLSRAFTLYPKFATLYECKEQFRNIFNSHIDRITAEKSYYTWVKSIPNENDFEPFFNVVKTIKRWRTEVFNFFEYDRYSNGAVEAQNGVIKNVNRMGRGYSYEVIRAKVLYKTYATKKPKYKRIPLGKASASTPPFSMAMTHSGSFNIEEMYGYKTVLESGYGVDILELLSIIEEAEIFADIETADVLK